MSHSVTLMRKCALQLKEPPVGSNTELMSLWNETKSKCDELKQPKAWEWGNNLKTDQIAPWAML